jgi:hypothetical protein
VDAFFDSLRSAELSTLFAITFGSSLVWSRLFPRLRTDVAPGGIVSLQLAWTSPRASSITRSWRERHLEGAARRSIYVDFPFIVLYSFAIAFLALLAGRAADASSLASSDTASSAAAAAAIAAWTAGLCDYLENGGLLLILRGTTGQPLPALTSTLSAVKWLLATGAGLFSLGLLIASAVSTA